MGWVKQNIEVYTKQTLEMTEAIKNGLANLKEGDVYFCYCEKCKKTHLATYKGTMNGQR